MKFVLIVYVLTHGTVHSYVMDSGLTYDDCMSQIIRPSVAVEVRPGFIVHGDEVAQVCEPMLTRD